MMPPKTNQASFWRPRGSNRSTAPCLFASLATFLAFAPTPADAHLSIIRQGWESTGTAEAGDAHGSALAAGDFNGDGFEDLAMGAPFEDVGVLPDAGTVTVSWGTNLGITHVGAVALVTGDLGVTSPDDEFGYALAAGDFNGDGFDDLAVGAPGADLGLGSQDIGAVFVYHGSASGLVPSYDRTQGDVSGETHEAGDRFGAALCAGDMNDDGIDDLAVGAPGEDNAAGSVCWFSGGLFGLITGPQGSIRQSDIGQTNAAGDQFGRSLAIGNVAGVVIGGHSYDDLIIGAPFRDHSSLVDPGTVYVVLGTSSGPNPNSHRIYDASWGGLGGPQRTGWFGYSVASGHLYDGAYDGIAVGEPGRNRGTTSRVGRVVVGLGSGLNVDWDAKLVELQQDDMGGVVHADEYFGYALDVGYFDAVDGHEDLVIGSPLDKLTDVTSSTGWVGVSHGGPNGPGGDYDAYYQSMGNDPIEPGDRFGASLCLGYFDGTGRGNLAVGAPGEDGGSGMVHVFAPWRQRLSSPFVTQLAVDCENDPVYSVKPFDEICIASTTKTMTALIACERSQLPPGDPKYVSLDQEYTVPNWIRDNVGGSLYGFRTQERMTLRDLLSACIYPSGNDAAYAIADLLTGADNDWSGYSTTCAEFVTEMNFRALQLGMTRTVFTNPAGLDIDNHHSTAWDMAILGRAAMSNPLMASIVGSTGAVIYSHWQLPDDGPFVGGSTALSYGFLQKLKARSSAFDGVKPGRTPCADVTGVFSAKSEIGRTAIASAFGYDANLPRAGYYDEAAALMNLGLEECGSPIVIHPGAYESPWGLGDLLTSEGSYMGGGSAFDDWNPDSPYALVDLFRTTGEGTTMADFEIERFSDAYFDPSEIQTFGIAPFDSHEEIVFTNQGVTNAHFLVHLSYGGDYDFNLPAGNHAIIPCVREPDSSFWFTVTNRSGGGAAIPMNLGITEPYGFELTSLPVQSGPVFRARIERPNGILSDGFRLLVAGLDPVPGRTLYASVHDEGAVVDVDSPQPQLGTGAPKATLLSVLPNPFADRVTLDFQLETAGDVALRFFDAQGREVRSIAASRIPAGRWSGVWDGRDERAQVLPRGVYFYQLSLAGHPEVSGRVHLVR